MNREGDGIEGGSPPTGANVNGEICGNTQQGESTYSPDTSHNPTPSTQRAAAAEMSGGVDPSLDQTQDELDVERNARNNGSTPAPSKGFGRGLGRTAEERLAKANKRPSNVASVPPPVIRRRNPVVKLGLRRKPSQNPTHQQQPHVAVVHRLQASSESGGDPPLSPTHQQPHVAVTDLVHGLQASSESGGDEDSLQEVDVDSYQLTIETSRRPSTTSMNEDDQQSYQAHVLSTHNSSSSSISINIQEVDVESNQIAGRLQSQLHPGHLPSSFNISNSGLAVAQEIHDASSGSLAHAVEVDPAELEHKILEKKKRDKRVIVGFVIALIALAFLLGITSGLQSKDTAVMVLTSPPSNSTKESPSTVPTGI